MGVIEVAEWHGIANHR